MRTTTHHNNFPLAAVAFGLLLFWTGLAQGSQTNRLFHESKYGNVTNCIQAEVKVVWPHEQGRLPEIAIFIAEVARSDDSLAAPQPSSTNEQVSQFPRIRSTNTAWLPSFVQKLVDNDWMYFKATNTFCGPIELRNARGSKLPLLKPELSSPKAYPTSYSLSFERSNYWKQHPVHRGLDNFPPPLLTTSSYSSLARFHLVDQFEIKEPGEYTFTVWPKIYKKSATNSDICQRIDLPPVSATFQWNGPKQN